MGGSGAKHECLMWRKGRKNSCPAIDIGRINFHQIYGLIAA
jgi:hypothetical protein